MIEKFSDYENGFIEEEGNFVFTVENAELKSSKAGTPMAVFTVKSDAGRSTIYKSIDPKARWSYNKFIQACLNLSPEQRKTFELDYETIHNQLVGKSFIGHVVKDFYTKEVKVPTDEGNFKTEEVESISYKIDNYYPAKDVDINDVF